MILGFNKDLEWVLKDKEKYRKKLKEVLGDVEVLFVLVVLVMSFM